ncbi:MAG: twin-arginine translocase TatA/TatE family subunit [Desulfobacteraceae bacterium]
MFGLGMPEILLILALALIVIGPKRLPDLAKTLGKAMGEFKRATTDFKNSIDLDTGIDDIKPASSSIRDNIKEAKEPGKKDRTGEDEEDSSPGNESETENTDANGSGTGTNGDEPPNGNGNEKDKTGTRAD